MVFIKLEVCINKQMIAAKANKLVASSTQIQEIRNNKQRIAILVYQLNAASIQDFVRSAGDLQAFWLYFSNIQ